MEQSPSIRVAFDRTSRNEIRRDCVEDCLYVPDMCIGILYSEVCNPPLCLGQGNRDVLFFPLKPCGHVIQNFENTLTAESDVLIGFLPSAERLAQDCPQLLD